MKKLGLLALLLTYVSLVSSVSAQWLLVENFNDQLTDDWLKRLAPDAGEPTYVEDPFEVGNYGAFMDHGFEGIENYEMTLIKRLPDGGIAPNETGTIYLRYIQSGGNNLFAFGTGDDGRPVTREFNEVLGDLGISYPGGWGNYNVIIRKAPGDSALDHRDGGAYIDTVPNYVIADNVWYHFWIVASNSFDAEGLSTGTYKLYVQGPDDSEAQLLLVGGEKESAAFRRAPQVEETNEAGEVISISPASIVWAKFISNAGNPASPNAGDPFIFDDVYFTKGENLTVPTDVPLWADRYTIIDDRFVNTGSWLGWLDVSASPWVYSYRSSSFIYLPEEFVTDTAAWNFATKNPEL